MLSLIDRLERMGRRGAWPALSVAALLVLFSGVMAAGPLLSDTGMWTTRGMHFAALLAGALAMVFGILGARLLTAREYPPVDEIFPSLDPDDFLRAIREEERPLCACARCLIHLPARFSTGSCPRCASSVDYYEVECDDDAEMVVLAMNR